MSTLNRRQFMAATSVLGLASAFGLGRASAQEKTLRMFWWGNTDRLERTEKVIDLYQAANPGVTVMGETASFADFWPRLATQIVGDAAPDIIQMDFRYLSEYASRGALLPLDEYLGNKLDLSAIPADQVDANRGADGKLYGISFGVNVAACHVNETAWEEAGVEAPKSGITYEELAERALAFKAATKRSGMFGLADASGVEVPFENFLRQRGKALYTADGEIAFDTSDARDWFALWQDMRKSGACVPADVQATDLNTVETSMLVQQRAALAFGLANAIGPTRNAMQDSVGLIAYPLISADAAPGHYLRPATRVSISATTPDPELAVDFLAYFTQDIEAAKILGAERGIPVDPKIQEAIAPLISPAESASVDYVASINQYVGALPPLAPPGAGEVTTVLQRISQEVGFEAASPEDGASSLLSEAEAILARS
ncbi:ABC transporter substrate-binding protein [Devosia sp. SD17-2]|uniref:ABC transporter substrate-binding protein n=1 Tax=Devosia sp. SD17-2 TaxID=2976459 RepID=UPI0023D8A76C|nr:ABC transporter substrate-binding protein [Devosia sp. SD17-2]WEJ32942.1 ABC transporter substrate-binding protein [Devosia sp. SD17-2]